MLPIFVLLVVYQGKHFLADYPLQTPYMLQKFKPGWDFVKPLGAHAGVHAAFTWVIANVWCQFHVISWQTAVGVALLDFCVHFTVDRIKASPKMLGRYKSMSPSEFKADAAILGAISTHSEVMLAKRGAQERMASNRYFWWALGWDQMMHHLTHYVIIYFLLL